MSNKKPDYEKETELLKSTPFEDLPLLINDMGTQASKMNYKNKLAGADGKTQYVARSEDPINGYIEVKQIEDSDINEIANKMRNRTYRKGSPEPSKEEKERYLSIQ